MIFAPIQQQPRWPALIDRQNPLGAKVITYLPLSSEVQRGTGGQAVVLASGTYASSIKGRSLQAATVAGASVALDLSAYSAITLAFWLNWDAFANDDKFAGEFTNNWNSSNAGAFTLQVDESGSGLFVFGSADGTGHYWSDGFTRPSSGQWHRYVLTMDRSTPVNTAFVDGVAQTLTASTHAGPLLQPTFANDTLYLFSRGNATFFGAGKMQDFTIYRGILSAAEAISDYVNPWQILMPMRRFGAVSLAADGSLMGQSRQMYAMGLGA